jgi:hypothetical protein
MNASIAGAFVMEGSHLSAALQMKKKYMSLPLIL